MKETEDMKKKGNEDKSKKKGKKSGKKATVGDIIFRVLILIIIFFIVAIGFGFYMQGVSQNMLKNQENQVNTVEKKSK